jgi:Family of unknown function (DUF5752)
MTQTDPFYFSTERRLVRLTGRRARTLAELIGHVEQVSGSSIFYHTHHLYLSHHFLKPVFFNDFANWAMDALQERELGEKLAAIDLLEFQAIRPMRNALLDIMTQSARARRSRTRTCPPGDEFHFCESQSFIVPTGLVARSVPELFQLMPHVSNVSLYFHFFEARLRLDRKTNDFSYWLEQQGARDLAGAIDRLDPYIMTLDELRSRIVDIGTAGEGGGHGRTSA